MWGRRILSAMDWSFWVLVALGEAGPLWLRALVIYGLPVGLVLYAWARWARRLGPPTYPRKH